MSIIKHVTLQKFVAHDFRYDPRNIPYFATFSVSHVLYLCLHRDFPHHTASKHSKFISFPLSQTQCSIFKQNNWKNNFFIQLLNPYSDMFCNICKMYMFTIIYLTVPYTRQWVHVGTKTSNTKLLC